MNTKDQFVELTSIVSSLFSSQEEMTTRSKFGTTSQEGAFSLFWGTWTTSGRLSSIMNILGFYLLLTTKLFGSGTGSLGLASVS
jgi:hypothetical protein